MAHPASRRRIIEAGEALAKGTGLALGSLLEVIKPMLEEHWAAQEAAKRNLVNAKALLEAN
jgi:hypothetical protein